MAKLKAKGVKQAIISNKPDPAVQELAEEFWISFVRNARVTLHLKKLAGTNSHHIIEGAFKAAARTLRKAVSIDSAYADEIPSTKGLL